MSMGETLTINGKVVTVKRCLNCKSRNVLYLAQCVVCKQRIDNAYTGQTGQPFHKRVNGHRSCFVLDKNGNTDPIKVDKSALALHSHNEHSDNFNLRNFKFILTKQVRPRNLDRGESIQIGELRTNVMGLNRMNVQT